VKDSQRSIDADEKHKDPIYEMGELETSSGHLRACGQAREACDKRVDCRLAANRETGALREKREK